LRGHPEAEGPAEKIKIQFAGVKAYAEGRTKPKHHQKAGEPNIFAPINAAIVVCLHTACLQP
jgi:hypothetical protein